MPTRARLLDLGEVGSERSLGIPHAVASSMGPDSDPASFFCGPLERSTGPPAKTPRETWLVPDATVIGESDGR
jgi:hypothetical protein